MNCRSSVQTQQRRSALLSAMAAASFAGDDSSARLKAMSAFVDGNVPVRDLLMPILASSDNIATAMEIYVRQTYRTHTISDFKR
jgi:Acetyl-CoA carboxylase, central region